MMLILLSPAKKLLAYNKPYLMETTRPLFQQKTAELKSLLNTLSIPDIARLMHLSDALATLNYQRYQDFQNEASLHPQGYPAVFLFRGDVYQRLDADQWDAATLDFAQSHVMILSGLYGLLRPLDLIEPYRLEMGTPLANACGSNLYPFWKKTVTDALNQRVSTCSPSLIVNLASTEYFNVVDVHSLQAPLLTPHFKERKGDQFTVVGVHAKKARGAMASYISRHQIDDVEKIKQFTGLNYRFCERTSDAHHFNFIRG